MPKKRKSRGRHKGDKGKESMIQCDECGALIPRSKAIKVTRKYAPIDPQLATELRSKGAIIPTYEVLKLLCVRCAVYRGVVKIRPEEERKKKTSL
ncbi:MAG: 30S ribosomal protein S26e [Thermofilaceae archaeon]|nr:30S ribosomal protein S26e [Thermofilaceae archaeon]MCX8180646.1 30S ribosomal protein S26e [Thermofilaceae archaeon]MDW8003750.1 30S ribosomal protein S26e [Thermofilaceae archaeon]